MYAFSAAKSGKRIPFSFGTRTSLGASMSPKGSRRLHVPASGHFHAFDDAAIKRLPEKTMVSTYDSEKQVLARNPNAASTIKKLREANHKVAFNVDVRKLHKKQDPHIAEMYRKAKEGGIDMSKIQIDFLRHPTEKRRKDKKLINKFLKSAAQTDVSQIVATHTLARFNKAYKRYNAPAENDWIGAAFGTGFEHKSTLEAEGLNVVESVVRDHGGVDTLRVKKVARSLFVKNLENKS